jgi:hypothetical protein
MLMSNEQEYDLVVPFVVVASKGGPYDDEAYCAGWQMATVDSKLANCPEGLKGLRMVVYSANRPQADLVAMRHGFTTIVEDTEYDEWLDVTFLRSSEFVREQL